MKREEALQTWKDEDLIDAFLRGDDNAFRELVRRYEPVVIATITGMIGVGSEVDDVAQETFIRFYRSLQRFRGESSVKTYITRIAINQSIELLKRRRRRALLFFQKHSLEDMSIPDERSEDVYDDTQEVVTKAIQKLDAKSRAVIVLRLIDGYSTKETAKILGVPLGTVKSRVNRARSILREKLKPRMEERNALSKGALLPVSIL